MPIHEHAGHHAPGMLPDGSLNVVEDADDDDMDSWGAGSSMSAMDAGVTPRTLYVSRNVLNADEIIAWAKGQGFPTVVTPDQMHVTVIYSKTAVDWNKMGSDDWGSSTDGTLTVPPGGPRSLELFGPNNDVVVLAFFSNVLLYRHDSMVRSGASWDYDEYVPHITLTLQKPADLDLDSVVPYRGAIKLGPEIFAEVVDDGNWRDLVTEDAALLDYSDDQDRDDHGRWTRGGMTLAKPDRSDLPEHIKALKLPPAWKRVQYSQDPNAKVLAIGQDEKGRDQYVYSQAHVDAQSAAKFARVSAMASKFDDIKAQVGADRSSDDPLRAEHADAAHLILNTGIRPGSDEDTGAKRQAYGATTLEGRHVVTDEKGNTSLQFVGKSGKDLNIPVEDASTAAMLQSRAAAAGENGQLFPNTTDSSLRDYVHGLGGGGFKTKDIRTTVGTMAAREKIASMAAPTSPTAYKKAVSEVAKHVSKKLGNTPTVALQSYIDPHVFGKWRNAA